MSKKSAAAANNAAAAIAADFTARAESLTARVQMLTETDVSAFDEDATAAHKAALLAAKNRAARNASFAKMMQNEKFSAAFIAYSLTVEAVNALQIYAQDKLIATMQAIAAECPLSRIAAGNHSNMMTQKLIAALDANANALTISDAPRKMHDQDKNKSMGTYSAQASSSRQVLDILGLLDWNANTKAFSLNARGESLRAIIAH